MPIKPALLFIFLLWPLISHGNDIQFYTHSIEGKFYIDENKELRGIAHSGRRAFNIELIREIMALINHNPKIIHHTTFKRGLHAVVNQNNIAFFNIARRPDREGKMQWVGPLQTDTITAYQLSSSPQDVTDLKAAKQALNICVLSGGSHEKFLKKNNFDNIISSTSYENCFRLLKLGHTRLAVLANTSLSETLATTQIKPDEITAAFVLYTSKGYLGLSNNISKSVVTQWQHALDELKDNGRYEQLITQFMQPK